MRLMRWGFVSMLAYALLAGAAVASTHYIAANGSDNNDGASQSSPWAHAPGMNGCTGTCASYSPGPGDKFIFRGGDSWHAAGSPTGLPWTWRWSGSGGNVIYIGVDQSWFSGSSFARPVLNMDNPLSTGRPGSCAHDDSAITTVALNGVSNVTFDNFEFTGKCWAGNPDGAYLQDHSSNNMTLSNNYFHGWTMATSSSSDTHYMIGGNGSGNTGNVYASNVFDGSDSSLGTVCNSPGCVPNTSSGGATGWAIAQECYDVHKNVFRHVSNGIECNNVSIVHDNLFEYLFEPLNDSPHGNVVESLGGISNFTAYNNITRNVNEGVNWWVQFTTGYVFNNVWENDGHFPPDPNCLMFSPVGFSSGGGPINVTVANNTFDGTCSSQAQAGNANTPHWAPGSTITWENNQILDRTSIGGFFTCASPSSCNQTDNGGEVFQSTSAANGQGYTLSNNYAPTLGSDATIGKGMNLTSRCGTFSSDSALCNGTSGAVGEATSKAANYPLVSLVPRPSTGSWNSGAYQLPGSAQSSQPPSPPSGLTALVQ